MRRFAAAALLACVAAACASSNSPGSSPAASGAATGGCTSKLKAAGSFTKLGDDAPVVLAQGAKKTVKIGFIGDLTGANSALIIHEKNAASLAIDQANAKGDLPVKIVFQPEDNKDALADTAVPLAQKLIGDPAVIAVIGPGFSGESKSTGALFEAAKLAHITPSATNPGLTKNGWTTFFRALANDEVQGGQTGELIVKGMHCTKVAVVNDKTDYGTGISANVVKSVKAAGGEVVLDEGIEKTTDYTSLVDSLLSKKPEVLYYAGYDAEASLVVKQYREKGGTAIFMGGDGDKSSKFLTDGAPANDAAVLTCPCLDPNASTEQAAITFAKDYKTKFGMEAGIYSSEGWDTANILIKVIKEAGANPTRAQVLTGVTNLKDYKGVSKTFNWTPEHEVVEGEITYVYQVKGGKYVLLGKATDLM